LRGATAARRQQRELPLMTATVQSLFGRSRLPVERDRRAANIPLGRSLRQPPPASRSPASAQPWLVDLTALARCRAIFAGHLGATMADDAQRPSHLSTMDVPVAYDAFCRAHFGSVRRTHPSLAWEDACPAYAIALSAHAALCTALDDSFEARLEQNWPRIRGESTLTWAQARPLIADGCSALNRLDPLAMRR
jgi:hypothetical protein